MASGLCGTPLASNQVKFELMRQGNKEGSMKRKITRYFSITGLALAAVLTFGTLASAQRVGFLGGFRGGFGGPRVRIGFVSPGYGWYGPGWYGWGGYGLGWYEPYGYVPENAA